MRTLSDRVSLRQVDEEGGEWWVLVEGKRAIGFSGTSAHAQALQHVRELLDADRSDYDRAKSSSVA
jgi:hypothetical protein